MAAAFAQTSDYERGAALFEKGEFAAATPLLAQAARAHPNDARMWKALGVAHAAQSLYRDAEPAFRRACELDPNLPDACYYLARALYALDRYEASLETLEAVARREPKSWKIQLGIAQAFEAIGKAGEAEREFVSAYGLCRTCNPQTGTAYGRFLVRQGRAGEAVAILEETVRRFPDTAEPRIHLGRALLDGGRVSDAIEQLERAAALDPKSAQAHLLLANAYMRAGRAADAQPHFEAAARNEGSGK